MAFRWPHEGCFGHWYVTSYSDHTPFKPVRGSEGNIYKIPLKEFVKLEREGIVKESADGYHYAKSNVATILIKDGELQLAPMRWDLIPRDFMSEHPEFDLATVIKKKNSRAKNPETQKNWGFDSFNARMETLASRPAFRKPWKEGQRCILPFVAFQERANMAGAPTQFKNRSWEIKLDQPYFLGGIWERWERKGEVIDSCTVITMDSAGHDKLQSIYHERHPLILKEDMVEEWLNPKTSQERARKMIAQFPPEKMTVTEILKKPKSPS